MDLAEARAKCLQGRGWAVKVAPDASFSIDLKPGSEDPYNRDDAACLKELGVDPDAPPSEVVFKKAFKLSVEGAACLRSAGWPVSRDPSYAAFKDSYESNAWFPWSEVPLDESDDALEACPAPPPDY